MTEAREPIQISSPYHVYVPEHKNIERILDSVAHDEYCAVVGPRHSGKSELLNDVASRLRADPTCSVVMINCYRLQSATEELVFASIAREMLEQLPESAIRGHLGRQMPGTPLSFRRFAQAVADQLGQRLVLFIDHCSAIPQHHTRSLLTSLRAAYMERPPDSPPLVVVVASSLNLAKLTVGRTSPFYNIARHVIIDDLSAADARFVIDTLMQRRNANISGAGMARLVSAVGGDRALILRITAECAQLVSGYRRPTVTANIVERAIDHFLAHDALDFRPLKESAELVAQDLDVLQNIRDILTWETVPLRKLRLPLSSDIDPTFLTGTVRLVSHQEPAYAIKNEVYRRFLSGYFDPTRVSDIYARAGRWHDAIGILVRAVGTEPERYHEPLAAAVISAMYAEDAVKKASRTLAESLPHLFDVTKVQIFVRDLEAADLMLHAEIGLESSQRRRTPLSAEDTLEVMGFFDEGESVRMGADGEAVLSIPLRPGALQSDSALGVVLIREFVGHSDFAERRLDVYRISRFMREAALALKNVYTRCRQRALLDRRSLGLDLLQRISSHVQLLDDLDVILNLILTGVTAYYGLGFNRAVLYLLGEPAHEQDVPLVGRTGIGQLEKAEAEAVWERARLVPFEEYLQQVRQQGVESTPVGELVRVQSIALDWRSSDAFSRAALKGQATIVKEPAQAVPPAFFEAFQPTTLAVVPLRVAGQVIGLLAADKKFTGAVVEEDDLFLLEAYANQAAAAVESERRHRREAYIAKLTQLHQTMRAITADLDREPVIQHITQQAVELMDAVGAAFYRLRDGDYCREYTTSTERQDAARYPAAIERAFAERLLLANEIQELHDLQRASSTVRSRRDADPTSEGGVFVCYPLVAGERGLGLLCIELDASQWLDDQARRILDLFIDQAAIALQNADHVAELTRMQDELASKEAIEQMSLIGAKWHHDLRQKTFSMLGNVDMLADDLADDAGAQEMLDEIRQVIAEIRRIPIPFDRKSAPPRKRPLKLDPLLEREVRQHCGRHPEITLELDLQCAGVQVQIDEERFGTAIEILVQNAVKAMDYTQGRLVVRSQLVSGHAQVIVQDTGRGIPEERRDAFLKRPIHRTPDESGTGVGVLIALRALQSFGADLKLIDTGPHGTTLAVRLPLADQGEDKH